MARRIIIPLPLSAEIEHVAVVLLVLLVELDLMAVVGDEGLHGLVAGVFPQQAFERRLARGEVLIRPARLRQGERGDELVASSLERLDVVGHRIQPTSGIGPEPLDDGRMLVREPGGAGNRDITSLFKEAVPIRQTSLETYVVDSTFRPDQV